MIRPYMERPKWKCLQIASKTRARKIVDEIVAGAPDGLISRVPPNGYQRGIDYYDHAQLYRVVVNLLTWYRFTSGESLNLLEPVSFSEKLNHAKLFAAMKIPETGNKSLTATFIPDHLRELVHYPEIVWRSPTAVLPSNDELAPGVYYLKTNHGSGWVRRIEYPLSHNERTDLEREFAAFLKQDYGVDLGEWWYNTFDRELIMEKAVSTSDPSTSLLFYVIAGEIGNISVDQKPLRKGGPTGVLFFDSDFTLSEFQRPESERLKNFALSSDLKATTMHVAREIGRQFACIRVDLMVGDDGKIYLNELTHMSNSGRAFANRKLDYEFGMKWDGREIYLVTY